MKQKSITCFCVDGILSNIINERRTTSIGMCHTLSNDLERQDLLEMQTFFWVAQPTRIACTYATKNTVTRVFIKYES